jgi:phage RecT family recombinase
MGRNDGYDQGPPQEWEPLPHGEQKQWQPPAQQQQPQSTLGMLHSNYTQGEGVDVLAGLVPPGIDQVAVLAAFCATVAASNDLMTCTYQSMETALRDCGRMGLLPGPADHVYLIPRGGKLMAQVGYQGLLHMIRRSTGARVETGEVCECDAFEVTRSGGDTSFSHTPDYKADRSMPYAWWGRAIFPDDYVQVEVMTRAQVEKVRDEHGNKALWSKNFDEKARITVARRLAKWLGKDDALGHAFNVMDREEPIRTKVVGWDKNDPQAQIRERMGLDDRRGG